MQACAAYLCARRCAVVALPRRDGFRHSPRCCCHHLTRGRWGFAIRPRPETFAEAVAPAEQAIRTPRIISLASIAPELQAEARRLFANLRPGDAILPKHIKALEVLINPMPWPRRGRPKAAREMWLVEIGLSAPRKSDVPVFRDPAAPHERSRCDAVALAMRHCGTRRRCTHDAVAAIDKRRNREKRKAVAVLSKWLTHILQALRRHGIFVSLLADFEKKQSPLSPNLRGNTGPSMAR